MSWGDEDTNFHVVVNDEEQYSIWPDYKAIPAGWRQAGKSGKREECLAWVDEVWTDMRPLSLRQAMAEDAASIGRTQKTMAKLSEAAMQTPGIRGAFTVAGLNVLSSSNSSAAGVMFTPLLPFSETV